MRFKLGIACLFFDLVLSYPLLLRKFLHEPVSTADRYVFMDVAGINSSSAHKDRFPKDQILSLEQRINPQKRLLTSRCKKCFPFQKFWISITNKNPEFGTLDIFSKWKNKRKTRIWSRHRRIHFSSQSSNEFCLVSLAETYFYSCFLMSSAT